MNECVICNKDVEFYGCKECGKFLFKDNINLIINNQKASAQIFVTEKKILINGVDQENIDLSVGQTFLSSLFDQFGILGILLNPYNRKNDSKECIIDMNLIKNMQYPYNTDIQDNCIMINVKKVFVIHIENESNRQRLVNAIKKIKNM